MYCNFYRDTHSKAESSNLRESGTSVTELLRESGASSYLEATGAGSKLNNVASSSAEVVQNVNMKRKRRRRVRVFTESSVQVTQSSSHSLDMEGYGSNSASAISRSYTKTEYDIRT